MSSSSYATRPASVTVVMVLAWIAAVLAILAGIALLVTRFALTVPAVVQAVGTGAVVLVHPGGLTLIVLGIAYLVIGLITASAASGLGRGNPAARVLVAVMMVAQLVVALLSLFTAGYRPASVVSSAAWDLVIAVLVLALLYNARANRFFARG